MDFALLESGTAARASHKITAYCPWPDSTRYAVYVKRRWFWVIPYWAWLEGDFMSVEMAEAWLMTNWKLPRFYHITRRKGPAE